MSFDAGPPFACIDKGVSSEIGSYVSVAKYEGDWIHGFGTLYAANGAQLFWKQTVAGQIEFTGGTGRFEGVIGSFTYTVLGVEYAPGPEGTLSVVITYTGEGTITY